MKYPQEKEMGAKTPQSKRAQDSPSAQGKRKYFILYISLRFSGCITTEVVVEKDLIPAHGCQVTIPALYRISSVKNLNFKASAQGDLA